MEGYMAREDLNHLWDELVQGLKDFFDKAGFRKAVVGVSGGLDSAVVLAIAVQALGHENVTGITMPSRFNSKETIQDALLLCENQTVRCLTIPISGIAESFHKELPVSGVAAENLQARIRGVLLMEFSNEHGGLVLCPTNKSEAAMGYSTLYGDTVGSYAPIGDVLKTDVFALAQYFNDSIASPGRTIPDRIISRPPSAELSFNQVDSDSLPPYEILDEFLHRFVELGEPLDTTSSLDLEMYAKLVSSAWKREQEPTGIKVSNKTLQEWDGEEHGNG